MITLQNIIDEVNLLLIAKYPKLAVYINRVPEGFKRPSFFIELIDASSESMNKDMLLEKVFLRVMYFSQDDEYGVSDSIDKNMVLSNIVHTFRKGYIKIDDRALCVAVESGSVDDEVIVDLRFEYIENRLREDEEPIYEKVGEIIINTGGVL